MYLKKRSGCRGTRPRARTRSAPIFKKLGIFQDVLQKILAIQRDEWRTTRSLSKCRFLLGLVLHGGLGLQYPLDGKNNSACTHTHMFDYVYVYEGFPKIRSTFLRDPYYRVNTLRCMLGSIYFRKSQYMSYSLVSYITPVQEFGLQIKCTYKFGC